MVDGQNLHLTELPIIAMTARASGMDGCPPSRIGTPVCRRDRIGTHRHPSARSPPGRPPADHRHDRPRHEEDAEQCSGMEDYVSKPISAGRLFEEIESVLTATHARS
ncbi:MAG: hypothetical protein WDO73_20030 [Ignavibacteriota bacterium]